MKKGLNWDKLHAVKVFKNIAGWNTNYARNWWIFGSPWKQAQDIGANTTEEDQEHACK